jgi:hypothetical protein
LSWPDEPKVEHNAISVDQAVNFAWGTFKKRYGLFSAVLLTIFVAWIGLEIVVIAGQRFGILLWALAHLAFLLFFASVEIGFLQVCLGLYDGKEPKYADTFAHWSLGIKFLAGQIFFLLVILIGLLLLVVPGLYIGSRYALFGFCIAAGEADLINSFRQSAILSTGAGIKLLGICAALLLLNVLGASLLGLGLFITIPVSALVATAIYRKLSSR